MQFLEIRSKVKNHHISEAGVSFEIQFCQCIKIWAGEHIFYIRQQTIALKGKATLKENIIKMKDILFPNILVQVS